MNLLCPNCHKTLTVPEQYAGQLMKCPLCSGNFTVPSLPETPELTPPNPTADADSTETYDVRNDPAPTPLSHYSTPVSVPTKTASETPTPKPLTSSPPTYPSQPPVGYNKAHTLFLAPNILQYVAPVAVALLFFLQMFTWVGLFTGGVPVLTQGAWSAAYAFSSKVTGAESIYPFDLKAVEPDASGFLILYTLLFLITLVITLGIVILPHVQVPLPPVVQRLLPYRWGIAAVLNLLVFFFLAVQLLVGFNLETKVATFAAKKAAEEFPEKKTIDELKKEARKGEIINTVQRTVWLYLAILLHLLAIGGSSLMYWLNLRGDSRPLPRFEFAY